MYRKTLKRSMEAGLNHGNKISLLGLAVALLAAPNVLAWSMPGADPNRSSSVGYDILPPLVELRHKALAIPSHTSVATGHGLVFAASLDGWLYGLNFQTGDLKWACPVGENPSSPTIVGGLVVVASSRGVTACAQASGVVVWSYNGSRFWGQSSIIPSDSNLAVAGGGGIIMLDGIDGRPKWTLPFIRKGTSYEAPAILPETGALAVADGLVYTGDTLGAGVPSYVWAIDSVDGIVRWAYELRDSWVWTLAIADEKVIVGAKAEVIALDRVSGSFRWRYGTFDSPVSLAVAQDTVVVGSRDGNVHAIDKASGRLRWKFRTTEEYIPYVAVANSTVVVSSEDGHLYLLDLATGRQIWVEKVTDGALGPVSIDRNRLFIVSSQGVLHALESALGRAEAPPMTTTVQSPATTPTPPPREAPPLHPQINIIFTLIHVSGVSETIVEVAVFSVSIGGLGLLIKYLRRKGRARTYSAPTNVGTLSEWSKTQRRRRGSS
jgi:outer membrane protein assembly factor BamB